MPFKFKAVTIHNVLASRIGGNRAQGLLLNGFIGEKEGLQWERLVSAERSKFARPLRDFFRGGEGS